MSVIIFMVGKRSRSEGVQVVGTPSKRGMPALGSADAADPAIVGGKAASLTRLMGAGLDVPAGFVVPTSIYREILAEDGLLEWIQEEVGTLDARELAALDEVAARIQGRLGQVRFPDRVVADLCEQASRLLDPERGELRVAVRSSAILEDLPEASFAGQHATFLDVRRPADLVARIRDCWASLFGPRALAYRHRLGLAGEELAAAVVIQDLAETEVAGVLFTADPVTGVTGRYKVEATWGLGEGVVSGSVDPDSFELDGTTGRVLTRRIGAKATRVIGGPEGSRREDTPAALRGVPCLDEWSLASLAAGARAAEEAFGVPLDIEWGLRRGKVVFLQARPITTGFPATPGEGGGLRVYTNANFAETMPDPPSPLGWSLFRDQIEEWLLPPPEARPMAADFRLTTLVHGRPYWDITPALWSDTLWRFCRDTSVRATDGPTARALDTLRRARRVRSPARRLLDPASWARVIRFLRWLPGHTARLVATWFRPAVALRRVEVVAEELRAALRESPPRTAPSAEHARELARVLEVQRRLSHDALGHVFLSAMTCAAQVLFLCWLWLGERESTEVGFKLAAGRRGNQTYALGLRLWELSRAARRDPEVLRLLDSDPRDAYACLLREHGASDFMRELESFLADYGHRGPGEQDLETPRWAEDPATLLPILRGAARCDGDAGDPATRRAGAIAEYEALRSRSEAQLGSSWFLPRLKARVFSWLLDVSEQLFPIREDLKHHVFRGFLLLKQRILLLAEALVREGHLAREDDVWYLDVDELCRWASAGCPDSRGIRGTILRRRMDRARHRGLEAPRVVTSDGEEFFAAAESHEDAEGRVVLRGEAGSRGKVTGRARVLLDPRDGHLLEPGEILVAPFTDPGWTPLFLTAAGLVMDVGGTISHGVITAREYGIPAVVGIPGATRRIRDGDLLTLDGARGEVRLEPGGPPDALERAGASEFSHVV